MTIIITGCAGFIGTNFTEYWLAAHPEDRVIGVDCLTYAANREALSALCERERERFAFYERAKKAFAVVISGETAKYGNVILKKGVTPGQ